MVIMEVFPAPCPGLDVGFHAWEADYGKRTAEDRLQGKISASLIQARASRAITCYACQVIYKSGNGQPRDSRIIAPRGWGVPGRSTGPLWPWIAAYIG